MAGNAGPAARQRLPWVILAATVVGACNPLFGIHQGQTRPSCVDPTGLLIDDMEDGELFICNLNGRHGAWYRVGDGTSTDLTPGPNFDFKPSPIPDGGRGTSRYAVHFTGSGFTDWGALVGFGLNVQGAGQGTYDASTTGGITFWMKSNAPVSVNFLIPETVEQSNGGQCGNVATDPNCNSHFSFQITAPGPGWVEYHVPFAALTQQYGGTATWNPTRLLGVQFLVHQGVTFDIWIDDIRFYFCGTSECIPTCTDPLFPVVCPANGRSRTPAVCRSAGIDCSQVVNWCVDPLMIDDMEDGGGAICDSGGRKGSWYTTGDGSSKDLSPAQDSPFNPTRIPGGRDTSAFAAHMAGSGFTKWGALMGFSLNAPTAALQPYDASAHGGIKFWIKSNVPVQVEFSTPDTLDASQGGTCVDNASQRNCYNKFAHYVAPTKPDEWREQTMPFTAFRQFSGGTARWDPSRIVLIDFAAPGNSSFDVWVDDIRFYNCMSDACVLTCTAEAPVSCPASGDRPSNCWPTGTACSNPPEFMNTGVWGSGPNDVWAVGYSFSTFAGTVLHWDGTAWSAVPSGTNNTLYGVWGSGPNDVWAVGSRGTIVHWNGVAWSATASGVTSTLTNGVWGSGPNDVWATGLGGTLVHWDGSAWAPGQSGTTQDLWGVWGGDAGTVWAAGVGGTILRWDGSTWSATATGTTLQLDGVWTSGPNDVWAVGDMGITVHWNGATWSTVPSGTTQYLDGVWGSGPNDVWAVGDLGAVLHWDGAAWSTVPSGTTHYLVGVWGSGPSDVWAVGDLETIIHWNGLVWSVVPTTAIH